MDGPQCGVHSISSDAASHKLGNRSANLAHSALVYVEVLRDLVASVAADDVQATRTVYAVVVALGVIGVALVILAIWLVRQTRPERELLSPLERMNDRSWRKQEPAQMRRDLDEVRPIGARPVVREQEVPEVDDEFAQSRPALGTFDDLQAQLASDARRQSGVMSAPGADPLLAVRVTADPSPKSDDEVDDDAETNDAGEALDDTDNAPRPVVAPDEAVPDGAVTHTGSGSADIAALVTPAVARPANDTDDAPDDGAELTNTDSSD